jgi:hypothetical protein
LSFFISSLKLHAQVLGSFAKAGLQEATFLAITLIALLTAAASLISLFSVRWIL